MFKFSSFNEKQGRLLVKQSKCRILLDFTVYPNPLVSLPTPILRANNFSNAPLSLLKAFS